MNTFGSLLYKIIFPLAFAISLSLFFYFLQTGKVKATVWSGFFVFLFIALTVTLFLQDRLLSEPKTSGVLVPGNESTPSNPCNNIPSNAIILLFGNSAAYTTKFPHTVIQVGKQNLLTIDKQDEKITISAKFFSKDGRIVAELERNKFYINPNNYFRKDRPFADA